MTGFPHPVAQKIVNRDGWACARCGRSIAGGTRGIDWSIHHRLDRGMGGVGRKNDYVNEAGNGVVLCGSGTTLCHGWVTAHKAEAKLDGFSVSRGAVRPTDIPIQHFKLGLVRLLDDGTWEEA